MGSMCSSGIKIIPPENLDAFPKSRKMLDSPQLRFNRSSSERESHDSTDSGSVSVHKVVVRGFEILETLGKGTFGTVKKARNPKTGATFALKFIFKNRNFHQNTVVREIHCMQRTQSPYVAKLYAYSMNVQYPLPNGGVQNSAFLVMEFASGGDLYELLYYSHAMEEKLGRTYFHQLCEGLRAIHAAGVIHRDLKPQNVLVDYKFCLKITDFGHSVIVGSPHAVLEGAHFGTPGFRAPEIVLGRSYTSSCDVFALGVILFNMMTHRMPFRVASVADSFYYLIARNSAEDWNKFWKINKNPGSPELRDLIQRLLCYQPRDRIALNQVMQHPWFGKDKYPDSALKELLWKTHLQAHEAKLKDPTRAKRLESGPVPRAVHRAFDSPSEVESVSSLDPFAVHYELRQQTSVDKVMTNVKTYMSTALLAKFKKSGNSCCSGSYKANTLGKGTAKLRFEFGVIKRFGKLLFFLKIEKTDRFELTEQCETVILDALKSMDCVEGFYAEERNMSMSPDLQNYDFSELEREDSFYVENC